MPRYAQSKPDSGPPARLALWCAPIGQESRIYLYCSAHACVGDWREHGDFFGSVRRLDQASALQECGPAGVHSQEKCPASLESEPDLIGGDSGVARPNRSI